MAEGTPLRIAYRFKFEDKDVIEVEVELDPETMSLRREQEGEPPSWAKLEQVGCSVCTLTPKEHEYCPVATNLAGVVDQFGAHRSYERVEVNVTTAERKVQGTTTLQHALSSLTGIFMVTSGCPIMDQLRPMVRFHLPLATLEETTYRAASMYLLAQYLRTLRGLKPDWSLDGLERIYSDVHQVNLSIARCIRNAAERDANANALVRLDLFTDGVAFSIRDALPDVKHLFERAYMEDDDASDN